MLNQVILVGRIAAVEDDEIVLAIPRAYKNEEGIYETDMINISISDKLSDNAKEYLNVNDLVGVKGQVVGANGMIAIAATKLTFLSSKVNKEEE